jgi:hypothetical protein
MGLVGSQSWSRRFGKEMNLAVLPDIEHGIVVTTPALVNMIKLSKTDFLTQLGFHPVAVVLHEYRQK